jgi:hypothetical protein
MAIIQPGVGQSHCLKLDKRPEKFNTSARVGSPAAFTRPAEMEPGNRVFPRRTLNAQLVGGPAFADWQSEMTKPAKTLQSD